MFFRALVAAGTVVVTQLKKPGREWKPSGYRSENGALLGPAGKIFPDVFPMVSVCAANGRGKI
jgi:hypothetical protein